MSKPARLLESLLGKQEEIDATAPGLAPAFAWARVSTDMQEERGLSLPVQLKDINDKASGYGYWIMLSFHEADSAFRKNAKRIEFNKMLAALDSHPEVKAIFVHDYSRLHRLADRARTLVRELRERGIRVISLNDPEIDTETVAGVYMEAITFAKNEAYSREVSFHTRKGCRANVQARDEETGWCYKNGGQPLFGFKSVQLVRGQERRGRPIVKSIWLLDDALIAGRPLHEWARHCLIELAAKGVSLDALRDFCEQHGLPPRRNGHWSTSTWNSMLTPPVLVKYCGHEVWNVHRKDGSIRPRSEWITVENAHPAIISEEEAGAIMAIRRRAGAKRFDTGYSRSRVSPYLFSGGIFTCGRCDHNMAGLRTTSGAYYVCGSQPYRKGTGCGPGVYVPKEGLETEVMDGLHRLMAVCANPKGLCREVNEELRHAWEESAGVEPHAADRVADIERRIANIWQAIEEGKLNGATASARLAALEKERETLLRSTAVAGQPPQIDADVAMGYRRQTEKVLAQGNDAERKQALRTWVAEMKLAPEALEVKWTYRIPEPVVHSRVAGAGFEPATSGL